MVDHENKALNLAQWIMDKAIAGVPPLSPAEDLAKLYLDDERFDDDEARVTTLIKRESRKNFGTGFVTGFGGLFTIPVTLPASMGASWIIQARMVAAIATIYGHDLNQERIRSLVLLSLLGNAVKEVIKEAGVTMVQQVTGSMALRLNREIGKRLISKTGERGASRMFPVVGGVLAGGIDAYTCRQVGLMAKEMFADENPTEEKPTEEKPTAKKKAKKKVKKKAKKLKNKASGISFP